MNNSSKNIIKAIFEDLGGRVVLPSNYFHIFFLSMDSIDSEKKLMEKLRKKEYFP